MNRIASRSWIVLVFVLVLVAGTVFFVGEFALNAEEWAFFFSSPHVYNGTKLEQGVIVDREGTALLSLKGNDAYATDPVMRQAMLHWTGDREGNVATPLLQYYTRPLMGFDLFNGLYTYGNAPGVLELTISAKAQTAALEALDEFKGTVAVYNYKTGEILCAVSTPTFDPDQTPDIALDPVKYEGVYLNRFTQVTYTPGSIFKVVTTAAALEIIPDIRQQQFECGGELEIGGGMVTCEFSHGKQSLDEALTNSCNCAYARIAEQVGGERLQRYAEVFGITSAVSFDGITTEEGFLEAGQAELHQLCWAGIGQYTDLVNPCQFLTFMGAVANGGTPVNPYVTSQVTVEGSVTYEAKTVTMDRIMSRATSEALQEMMRRNVEEKYGSENFPGMTVCAKSGTAEKDGDAEPNALFAGFVMDEKYPLAFIVVVEDGGYGAETCVPIISRVLSACKEVLDGR